MSRFKGVLIDEFGSIFLNINVKKCQKIVKTYYICELENQIVDSNMLNLLV